MENTALINNSYRNRVTKGQQVTFKAQVARSTWGQDGQDTARLIPGETYKATVRGESNAGFQGIVMSVTLEDGRKATGISTGAII